MGMDIGILLDKQDPLMQWFGLDKHDIYEHNLDQ